MESARRRRDAQPAGAQPDARCELDIEQQETRVLDDRLHFAQEQDRLAAVDEPVVVRKREVHHRPNLGLPVDRHHAVLNAVHSEDRRLRRIQDWSAYNEQMQQI